MLCDVAGVFETKALTQTKVVPTAIRWRSVEEALYPRKEITSVDRLEVLPVPREALQVARHELVS